MVETQKLAAVSVDAGRNSWFVVQEKMKSLDLIFPQAMHYASDVRAAMWMDCWEGKGSVGEVMSLDTSQMPPQDGFMFLIMILRD